MRPVGQTTFQAVVLSIATKNSPTKMMYLFLLSSPNGWRATFVGTTQQWIQNAKNFHQIFSFLSTIGKSVDSVAKQQFYLYLYFTSGLSLWCFCLVKRLLLFLMCYNRVQLN